MAPLKRQRSERGPRAPSRDIPPCMSVRKRLMSLFAMIFGPILLLYMCLRCEKNQCVLFQLPLVIPSHISAYISALSAVLVISFFLLMFSFSFTSRPVILKTPLRDAPALTTGFSALTCVSLILLTMAYVKPSYLRIIHDEYLKMLSSMIIISILLSAVFLVLSLIRVVPKDRDYCLPMAFFYGTFTTLNMGHVELKYFFYVHVGVVAWGLLDILIVLNVAIERSLTAPLTFLAVSQLMVIAHTLLYENFLRTRPFMITEGLGFFWLMRVLLYLPFLHSLPVYYAATTGFTLPKQALLANCVFFLLGFVIYISSIHQRENFIASPFAYKNLKSIHSSTGKRLLSSGYWGIVQKPDYLGYMIIWLSWVIACGFSGMSVLALLVIYGTIFMWLKQGKQYKQYQHGPAWTRYINQVPKQIIPLVY